MPEFILSITAVICVFLRSSKFDTDVIVFLKATSRKPKRTSVQASWQNGMAERWVGSCRREMLDHVVARTNNIFAD